MLVKSSSLIQLGLAISAASAANLAQTFSPKGEAGLKNIHSYRPEAQVYHAPTSFDSTVSFTAFTYDNLVASADKNLKNFLGTDAQYVVERTYQDTHNQILHQYVQQQFNGLPIVNAHASIHMRPDGSVGTSTSSFCKPATLKVSNSMKYSAEDALRAFAKKMNYPLTASDKLTVTFQNAEKTRAVISGASFLHQDAVAYLSYFQTPKALIKTWSFQVYEDNQDNFWHAHVAAGDASVTGMTNWVQNHNHDHSEEHIEKRAAPDASFNVNPWNLVWNGPQSPPKLVSNPHNTVASPDGWVSSATSGTSGNNVKAHKSNTVTKGTGAGYTFNFPYDQTKSATQMVDFARTQLFYANNVMHDVFYLYGFDEKAGNFQVNNNGKGGSGNDAVQASAQDASGTNNANMMTPPDGQQGVMRQYIFDLTTPTRDSSVDNMIIFHEYGHGISNRLTGGPSNSDCLPDGESGGMGEGWSDWFAIVLELQPTDTKTTQMFAGAYTTGNPKGIRKYAYTYDKKVNPEMYSAAKGAEVHASGAIWANMLHHVLFGLVGKLGYSDNIYDVSSGKGNTVALQLIVDALKIQPCQPTFIQARDAIIQADKNRGGQNQCEIWTAFAYRGMGSNAKNFVNDATIPAGVCDVKPTTATTATATTTTTTTVGPTPTTTTPGSQCHDVCVSGPALATSCSRCASSIIKVDPYCGATFWDRTCVKQVESVCGTKCGAPPASCAHPICSEGGILDSACDPCVAKINAADDYCKSIFWDGECVNQVKSVCGISC